MRECEEKLKSVHLAGPRDWILRLTVSKLPKEAHVWSMQESWSVALTSALQDKTSSLTKQLAHDLDSRLSQVARLSCQTTLFGKNWPFAFQTHTSKIPLIPTYCRELSKRFLREKPLRKARLTHPQFSSFYSSNSSTLILSIVTSLKCTFSQIFFSPYPYLWECYLVLRKQLGRDQLLLIDAMGYSGIR